MWYQLHNAFFTDTRSYSQKVFTEGIAQGEYFSRRSISLVSLKNVLCDDFITWALFYLYHLCFTDTKVVSIKQHWHL